MTTITTGTSGPQAWKIALVGAAVGLATLVVVNLPQTTTDTTGQPVAQTATATLPESVRGLEYDNESTAGQVVSPGVTTQYTGNSGELMPYENGPAPLTVPDQARFDLLAPVITQQFLDGPSSAPQGAIRVDPGAAVAAGLNPGAIDAIVGGTTRVAPQPDSLADAQARASVAAQVAPATPLAVSDDALVNPVPEINAAQLIAEIIATERPVVAATSLATSDEALVNPVPEFDAVQLIAEIIATERPVVAAASLATSDEVLVRGVSEGPIGAPDAATNARWEALADAYRNGSIPNVYTGDPDPVVSLPANANAEAGTEPRSSQRIPRRNVSIR
jgi:hypothetical protein